VTTGGTFYEFINVDGFVKNQKYSLSLAASPEGPLSELECSPSRKLARRDGRGWGEGDKPRNSNVLFSPSPLSPPTRGGEFLLFTRSSTLMDS